VNAAAADADTVFDEQLLAATNNSSVDNNNSNIDCTDSDTVGAEAAASATAALANLLSAGHAANAVRAVAAGGLELLTLMAGASTTTSNTSAAAAAAVGRLRDAEAMVRCAAAAAEALANATRVCGTECAARVIALGAAGVVPLVLLCASRNALVSALMQLCIAVT
jgi:hypothetical protein